MFDLLARASRRPVAAEVRTTLFALAYLIVAASTVFAIDFFLAARWYESRFAVFFLSMTAIVVFVSLPAVGPKLANSLNDISRFLASRGAFNSNPIEEVPKFALIRILFGAFLFFRAYWIIYYMTPDDWSSLTVATPAVAAIIFALLVMIGLLTQPAFVFLILFQWQVGDDLLGTLTLGNDIAALLSILLLFANAGAHLSVDALLRKRQTAIGRLISATYYRFGIPPVASLQIAKLCTLFGYWCVCVYSLFIHLGEPAWMQGFAGPLLLSNKYMTHFGTEFTSLFSSSEMAVHLSKFALWGMLPWYLLLLPCVIFGGLARSYAITWGVLFFALSLFVLRLGWLAEFEFLFFAGLFWQKAFIGGPKTLQVAYDDRCNLCDRTVTFIKTADLFNRVDLKPLSKNHQWLIEHDIRPEDAQKDLYGVSIGSERQAAKGYDFYMMLSSQVLLLLPLYPILLIGKFTGGPAIYQFVANRRTKLFGVCELPTPKKSHTYQPDEADVLTAVRRDDPIVIHFLHVILLGIVYLMTIPTPYLFLSAPAPMQRALATIQPLGDAAHVYGLTPINVFNGPDLRLAENWFTISILEKNGAEKLLPILDSEGKRLNAHRSDRIYFGNTASFRRGVIESDGCQFDIYRKTIEYLARSTSGVPGEYLYRQYRQVLPPTTALSKGRYITQPTNIICDVRFSIH